MIIKKLVIYGYGKLVDREFDLTSQFHLFYGENEAGKSTLMSFIHSVLFGFPTRHSSLLRYEPKDSSRYGGKVIILDERYGEITVERVMGKVTGDVTIIYEDGTIGNEENLATLLYNKDRHFFENIYSFNLKGIEDIKNMNSTQLNRFLLSIGALGNEHYLSLADKYKRKASQLFKPTGRKPQINQEAQKLKEKQRSVNRAREKNKEYKAIMQENNALQKGVETIEKKRIENEKEIRKLNHIKNHKDTLKELHRVQNELKEMPDLDLPEDGLYQLKYNNKEIAGFRTKIDGLHTKQKRIQEEYSPSKDFLLYQEYEDELSQFSKELNDWEEKIYQLNLAKQQLSTQKKQLTETKIREGLPLEGPLPEIWTEEDKTYFEESKRKSKHLKTEQTELEEEIKTLKYRIEINDERIDEIEKSLWSLDQFKEIEEKSENQNKKVILNKREKKIKIGLLSSVFLLILLSFFILTNPLYSYLFSGILALATILIYFMHKNKKQSSVSSQELDDYYRQKNLREQWKETLASNDLLQEKKRENKTKLDDKIIQINNEQKQFNQWKKKKRLPESYTIEAINQKYSVFETLRENAHSIKQLNDQIKSLEQALTNRLNKLESLRALNLQSLDSLNQFSRIKDYLKQTKTEQENQKEYVKETETNQRDILYYVKEEKKILRKNHQLLKVVEASNEEEFIHLYHLQDNKQKRRERLKVLREKLAMDLEEIEQYQVEEIEQELSRISAEIEENKAIEKKKLTKIMELDLKIKELEDGGTYTELLQEFENEKSYYQEIVDEWNALHLASAVIEKTLHYAKEDKLPQTIETATTYFSYLTDGEYNRIVLEEDNFVVLDKEGNRWDVSELSRGTVEPLYIALRLAFIKNTKDSIRFPIVIDDSFVNLDSGRIEKIYQLLLNFSQDNQIIYLSFDQRVLTYLSSQHYTDLNTI